eukprot:m.75120 g.75120  ORF g.75120 m.75120 type:complete len:143 (+) comp7800_c0_seq1:2107-2535(+)
MSYKIPTIYLTRKTAVLVIKANDDDFMTFTLELMHGPAPAIAKRLVIVCPLLGFIAAPQLKNFLVSAGFMDLQDSSIVHKKVLTRFLKEKKVLVEEAVAKRAARDPQTPAVKIPTDLRGATVQDLTDAIACCFANIDTALLY